MGARQRVAMPRPEATRVVVVANQKGGVGKTTSTVNVAAALAQLGQRVLVIDLDPQGNASTALGTAHHRGVASTYDALVDGALAGRDRHRRPDLENLWVVPATIDLAGAEIELVSVVARENRLARALTAHPRIGTSAAAGEDRFDYVFIDCPPSLGLLTLNALVAGAEVMIPIQAEYYALEGLGQLLETVEMVKAHLNPRLTVSTILITMYDARTRLAAGVADEVREHFPELVLEHHDPALGAGLGGAVVRSDRDDLRPGVTRRAVLPGGRPRGRPARSVGMTRERPVRRGLGRGLGSLIPTGPAEDAEATDEGRPVEAADGPELVRPEGSWFAELPADQIVPNRVQPRQVFDEDAMAELVHSIREVGLLQPIVVRQVAPDSYELVMGERRWRAAQQAGLDRIPAIVRSTDDSDMLRDALLENLHRSQLNPLEEAAAYQQLLEDFGCTHDELASRIGRSRPQISNTSGCSSSPRPSSAGSPRACSAPVTPGPCWPSRTPAAGPPGRPGGRRGDQRARPGGDRGHRRRPRSGARSGPSQARRPGPERPGRPSLRPPGDPGQGDPRSAQGEDHRRVRLARRPAPDRRHHGPAQPE